MVFTLDDLIKPRKVAGAVDPRFGPLYKGEVLVDEVVFPENIYYDLTPNDLRNPTSVKCQGKVFFRGDLANGQRVRLVERDFHLDKIDVKGRSKEDWSFIAQQVLDRRYDFYGKILGVHWNSETGVPWFSHGEHYVYSIQPPGQDYLIRDDDTDLGVYLQMFEETVFQTTGEILDDFGRLEDEARRRFILGPLREKTIPYLELLGMDNDELMRYAREVTIQDQALLQGFEQLRDRMDYHSCLASLASVHLNQAIARLMFHKHEDPGSMNRIQPQIRNDFREELLQRFHEMIELKSKDEEISADDVDYLLREAFKSAATGEYSESLPDSKVFRGCCRGGERRRLK